MDRVIKFSFMTILKYLGHPFTVMIAFCAILITGEHFAGFYIVYILLALPYGTLHAILGIIGIGLLFIVGNMSKTNRYYKGALQLVAATCVVLSLIIFFYNRYRYNNSITFHETVPLLSLVLFGLIWVLFTINSIVDTFALKRTRVPS
jgi:hypothetical protein